MLSLLFPWYLSRLPFFVRMVLVEFLEGFILMELYTATTWNATAWGNLGFFVLVFLYGVFFVILPRIRDCGMSARAYFLCLIPVVNIPFRWVLLFSPSRVLPHTPRERTEASPAVAGSLCSKCGNKLLLASEGSISAEGAVVSRECEDGAQADNQPGITSAQ